MERVLRWQIGGALLLLNLLGACSADTLEDTTPVREDTGDTRDTGTTDGLGPLPLELHAGSCESLVDPWAPQMAEDVVKVWSIVSDTRRFTDILSISEEGDASCPQVYTDGSNVELVGGCTASTGWSFYGRGAQSVTEAGSAWTFEQFSFRSPSGEAYGLDGVATTGGDSTEIDLTWRSLAVINDWEPLADTWSTWNVSGRGGAISGYGFIAIAPPGVHGDFCFVSEFSGEAADCGSAGSVSFTGAGTATLAYGASPCECQDVTIDGGASEQVCP